MANQAVSTWSNRKFKEISHGAINGPPGQSYYYKTTLVSIWTFNRLHKINSSRIHKILKFNLFNRTPENLQPYQPLEVANASIDLFGLFFSLVTKKVLNSLVSEEDCDETKDDIFVL